MSSGSSRTAPKRSRSAGAPPVPNSRSASSASPTARSSTSLAFRSASTLTIATADAVQDVDLGTLAVRPLPLQGEFFELAWSPDGARLAAAGAPGLFVFDAATGDVAELSPDAGGFALLWSPDGAQLAYSEFGGQAHVWDGHDTQTFPGRPQQWLTDGRLVLIGGATDGLPDIDDAADVAAFYGDRGVPRTALRLVDPAGSGDPAVAWVVPSAGLSVSADGQLVAYEVLNASPSDKFFNIPTFDVRVRRLDTAALVTTFTEVRLATGSAFLPSDDALLLLDDFCGTDEAIVVGDATLGTVLRLGDALALALALAPDGQTLAYTEATTLRIVPIDGSTPPATIAEDVHGTVPVAWSPDGAFIAYAPFFGGFGRCV